MHKYVYKEVRLIYDVFQNYIVCSNHALQLLQTMGSVTAESIAIVVQESRVGLDEARDEIVNLRSGYPDLMREVDE